MTVGYTGGKEPNPTYNSILDSTEALLIEFDPSIVSFEDLLALSLKHSNPFVKPRQRQYRQAIWVQSNKQRLAAVAHVDRLSKQRHGFGKNQKPKKVYIDIEDIGPFYRAEDYHQDYLKKNPALMID